MLPLYKLDKIIAIARGRRLLFARFLYVSNYFIEVGPPVTIRIQLVPCFITRLLLPVHVFCLNLLDEPAIVSIRLFARLTCTRYWFICTFNILWVFLNIKNKLCGAIVGKFKMYSYSCAFNQIFLIKLDWSIANSINVIYINVWNHK